MLLPRGGRASGEASILTRFQTRTGMPIDMNERIAKATRRDQSRSGSVLRFPRLQPCFAIAQEPSFLFLRFEALAFIRRNIVDSRRLAELKRTDISDDRPAIPDRNLVRIGRHRPEAIRDHVEEESGGGGPHFIALK